MSTVQYPVLLASQFGSNSNAELGFRGATVGTIVTPPSVPTGRSLGNYALEVSLSAASVTWTGAQVVQPNADNGWSFGYWWRPKTNVSSGKMPLLSVDDGAANGYNLIWDSADLTLKVYDQFISSLKWTSSAVPDTTVGGNPWWFIVSARPNVANELYFYIYRHNGGTAKTAADWDLIDSKPASSPVTGITQGRGIWPRIYSAGANCTGEWDLGNIYVQDGIGSGPLMPIGVDMYTAFPNGKSLDNVNLKKADLTSTDSGTSEAVTATSLSDNDKNWTVNQWTGYTVTSGGKTGYITSNTGGLGTSVLTIDAWVGGTPATGSYSIGANDPRTGTGESEYPYVNDVAPISDATTSYLQSSSLLPAAQKYTIASGLVTGLNILGVTVFQRSQSTNVSHIAQTTLGSAVSTSQIYGTANVWMYDEKYSSSFVSAGVPFAPSDIDSAEIGHRNTGSGHKVSQIGITVAAGNDDTPNVNTASSTASPRLLLGIG